MRATSAALAICCALGVTNARAQVPVEPFVEMEVGPAHEGYLVRLTLVAPVAAPFDLAAGTVLGTGDDGISELVVGEDLHVALEADERREVFVRAYRVHQDRFRPVPGMPLERARVDPRLGRLLRDLYQEHEREARRSFERLHADARRRSRRASRSLPPLDIERLLREHMRTRRLPNAQQEVWVCAQRPAAEPCAPTR